MYIYICEYVNVHINKKYIIHDKNSTLIRNPLLYLVYLFVYQSGKEHNDISLWYERYFGRLVLLDWRKEILS